MNKLPWDFSRCDGYKCPVKDQCLRHEQLSNMGPWTPVIGNYCSTESGGEPKPIPLVDRVNTYSTPKKNG